MLRSEKKCCECSEHLKKKMDKLDKMLELRMYI